MPLFSSTYLKEIANSNKDILRNIILNESRSVNNYFDIFLSHSYLDRDEIGGLYMALTKKGYSVYVDWIVDPHLDRDHVTKETALLIRERMKSSKSLLLAVSTNAQMSKWMPWELGFVDGHVSRCAIVPVSKEGPAPHTFKRFEYLLLYPYLKRATINYSDELIITEAAHSYVDFNRWLKSEINPGYQHTNIDEL